MLGHKASSPIFPLNSWMAILTVILQREILMGWMTNLILQTHKWNSPDYRVSILLYHITVLLQKMITLKS